MNDPTMPKSLDPGEWAMYGAKWREHCEQARAWAALWKRAAKWHRPGNMMRIDLLARNMELTNENRRLRKSLEDIYAASETGIPDDVYSSITRAAIMNPRETRDE